MNIVKNTNGNVEIYDGSGTAILNKSIPPYDFRRIERLADDTGVVINTDNRVFEAKLGDVYLSGVLFEGTASQLVLELSANFFFKPLVGTEGIADGAITEAKLAPELIKSYMFGGAVSTQTISDDPSAPTLFSGFLVGVSKGINLEDAATSTFRNVSGRPLNLSGTFSYTPDKGAGINLTLIISAEVSTDEGVSWVIPIAGKRSVEISNNSESFGSKSFSLVNIPDNALFRYMAHRVGGELTFTSNPVTIKGQTVLSPIVDVELMEI